MILSSNEFKTHPVVKRKWLINEETIDCHQYCFYIVDNLLVNCCIKYGRYTVQVYKIEILNNFDNVGSLDDHTDSLYEQADGEINENVLFEEEFRSLLSIESSELDGINPELKAALTNLYLILQLTN